MNSGPGTDPKIGGAIAETILKELNQKGVRRHHYLTTAT